jgi:hypothetical protein
VAADSGHVKGILMDCTDDRHTCRRRNRFACGRRQSGWASYPRNETSAFSISAPRTRRPCLSR